MYDLIIVGAGPAGVTAGIYAARAGLELALVEKTFPGGQAARTHLLENYPGFPKGISGYDFAVALKEQAENLGVQIQQLDIDRLELAGDVKRVFAGGMSLEAHTVILAMGARAKTLGLESERRFWGAGVSYCATCDGAFFRQKDVAVIGGGNTAGEEAYYLSKLAKTVYIVHRRNEYRMQKHLSDRLAAVPNIKAVMETVVDEIQGDTFVKGVRLKNVRTGQLQTIPLDGVFIAVGVEAETGILSLGEPVLEEGYIVTNEGRETSIPGVFAAGDIVKKPLRQVVTAVSDGAVAVYSAQKYLLEAGY